MIRTKPFSVMRGGGQKLSSMRDSIRDSNYDAKYKVLQEKKEELLNNLDEEDKQWIEEIKERIPDGATPREYVEEVLRLFKEEEDLEGYRHFYRPAIAYLKLDKLDKQIKKLEKIMDKRRVELSTPILENILPKGITKHEILPFLEGGGDMEKIERIRQIETMMKNLNQDQKKYYKGFKEALKKLPKYKKISDYMKFIKPYTKFSYKGDFDNDMKIFDLLQTGEKLHKEFINEKLTEVLPKEIIEHEVSPFLEGGRQKPQIPLTDILGNPIEVEENVNVPMEIDERVIDYEAMYREVMDSTIMEYGTFLDEESGVRDTAEQERFLNILLHPEDRAELEDELSNDEMDRFIEYEDMINNYVYFKFIEEGENLGYSEEDLYEAWRQHREPDMVREFITIRGGGLGHMRIY